MYFLYILQSEKTGKYYIGSSVNLEKRLKEHNAGYTRSTKPYRLWKLIYSEQWDSKSEANKREWHLKHPAGYLEKKVIIEHYGPIGGVA